MLIETGRKSERQEIDTGEMIIRVRAFGENKVAPRSPIIANAGG